MENDPLHALLRQAFCAHVWLMERLSLRLEAAGDARAERVRYHKEYAEHQVQAAAHAMGETDAFLPMPPAPADDAVGWFDLGFSALLLELVVLNVRSTCKNIAGQAGDTMYGPGGEHFAMTRRYAFGQAVAEGERAIKERIRAFVVPAAEAWDEGFLQQALEVLDGRISKKLLLKEGTAILKASGLPDEPWLYVEPQLDRYGKAFGIGFLKKQAIKLGLRFT